MHLPIETGGSVKEEALSPLSVASVSTCIHLRNKGEFKKLQLLWGHLIETDDTLMCTGSQVYLVLVTDDLREMSGFRKQGRIKFEGRLRGFWVKLFLCTLSHSRGMYWMHKQCRYTPLLLDHLFGCVWLEEVSSCIWSRCLECTAGGWKTMWIGGRPQVWRNLNFDNSKQKLYTDMGGMSPTSSES